MTSLESRCLESFPAWLHSLGEDARALAAVLESQEAGPVRYTAAVALTYLFKSLDLIPDGLEDLGFVDDAFVFRVAAARLESDERALDETGTLARLAAEAELIREFLAAEYPKLETYVEKLGEGSARGRSVNDLREDTTLRVELVADVRTWADEYAVPSFLRDEKNLVKLRSFLTTRLAASV